MSIDPTTVAGMTAFLEREDTISEATWMKMRWVELSYHPFLEGSEFGENQKKNKILIANSPQLKNIWLHLLAGYRAVGASRAAFLTASFEKRNPDEGAYYVLILQLRSASSKELQEFETRKHQIFLTLLSQSRGEKAEVSSNYFKKFYPA